MTPDRDHRTTRRRFLQGTAATAAVATLPATATASHDEEGFGPVESAKLALMSAQGTLSGTRQRLFGDRSDAETAATNAREAFNPNSEEWVAWVNDHAHIPEDITAVALEFVPNPDDGESYTTYLTADRDSEGTIQSAEITDNFDGDPDERARLESIAAENADDEIEYAYEEFVTEDIPPEDSHMAYLAGKYRFGTEHVTSTLLGDSFEE